MQLRRVTADLGAPDAPGWADVGAEAVMLAPIPLDAQPTEYIRTKWADRPYGAVGQVALAGAHDGATAWVRIEWTASGAAGPREFPDGAALYSPLGGDAPAATIGAEGSTVVLDLWQAGRDGARALAATGPGRFRARSSGSVGAAAVGGDGRWAVVFARPLADVGAGGRLGIAVWDGAGEERAGIGAATPDWLDMTVEA